MIGGSSKSLTIVIPLLLLSVFFAGTCAQVLETLPLGKLVWSDEFDSITLNSSIWSYDVGAGGWGNAEIEEYTRDNVRVQDGHLVIAAKRSSEKGFTSGRIRTNGKLEIQYGTVVASIKVPQVGNGLWPAFWMLGANFPVVGWPSCGEIDIMEEGSKEAIEDDATLTRHSSAIHWDRQGQHAMDFRQDLYGRVNLADGFHTYRLDWTPTHVTTYVDHVWWTVDISPEACVDCDEFHQPFFFLLNMAVGGTYTGIYDEKVITASLPAELVVDYIRIYDNGDTVLHELSSSESSHALDCGVPDTCTELVLHTNAEHYTCGDRITWLMKEKGHTEHDACAQVAGGEFPHQCGPCNPDGASGNRVLRYKRLVD